MSTAGHSAPIQKVQSELRRRGVDVAVVTRPENVFYLTGYRASVIAAMTSPLFALMVPSEGTPLLMVRSLERTTSAETSRVPTLLFDDGADPFRLLASEMAKFSTGGRLAVGLELRWMNVHQHRELGAAMETAGIQMDCSDVTGVVDAIASVLGEAELEHMQKAAHVSDAGLRAGLSALRPGVEAAAVVGDVQHAMYGAGQSDFEKSFVALWFGPKGGLLHDTRLGRPLTEKDIATVEVKGVDNHYYACAQRTVAVGGNPTPEFLEAQDLVMRMNDAARETVRPGASAGEVFEAASEIHREATGQPYFRRVGASIGLATFSINLVPGNSQVIPVGMPMLIQTLVLDPVLVAFGTTVMVTEDGSTQMTNSFESLEI